MQHSSSRAGCSMLIQARTTSALIGAALLGCSTLQTVLAARIQQHPYIGSGHTFVLPAHVGSSTRTSMQHFWAAALFNCAGCSFLAAAPIRLPQQRSSPGTLIYSSMLAARISSSTIHPCSIIGLQHFLGRAGCSYWQQRSCGLCWLLVLAAALMKLAWYTYLLRLAGC